MYQMLPRTNCKACGCAGCYAFVFSLMSRKNKPSDCPDLLTEPFSKVFKSLNSQFGASAIIEGTDFVVDKDICTGCGDCAVVCKKALLTVTRAGMLFYRDEVTPVIQTIHRAVSVIHWDNRERTLGGDVSLCSLCEE